MLWDEPKIFFLERRYFFSIILSEFLKNRVALQGKSWVMTGANGKTPATPSSIPALVSGIRAIPKPPPILQALRPTVPPRRLVRRAAMKSHHPTITMIGMRGNPMETELIPIPAKTTAVIQKPQIVPVVPPLVRRGQSATSAIWCMASLYPIH